MFSKYAGVDTCKQVKFIVRHGRLDFQQNGMVGNIMDWNGGMEC